MASPLRAVHGSQLRSVLLAAAVLLVSSRPAAALPRVLATPPATSSSDCRAPDVDTAKFLNAASFTLKSPRGRLLLVPVSDDAARERGLMCVVSVPPDRGMIFVFPPPAREQNFWMKNTLVALDMVFIGTDAVVRDVAAGVPATPYGTPDEDVARREGFGQYVLELAAGDAARHGIVRGTKFMLPTLTAR